MSNDGLGYWPNISPPSVTQPVAASVITVALGMSLAATGFVSGTETLASTLFEVRTAPNGGGTLAYSTSGATVPALTLSLGQTYYVRARFTGSLGYVSPWSADILITT